MSVPGLAVCLSVLAGARAAQTSSVAALLQRATREPAFAARGLEEALVALGSGATGDIERALTVGSDGDDEPEAGDAEAPALARALGRLRKDAALPALARLRTSDSPDRRRAAAAGLGVVDTASGVKALVDLLDDPAPEVAETAIDGLVALDRSAPKLRVRGEVVHTFERGRGAVARVRAAECLVRGEESPPSSSPAASRPASSTVELLESALRDGEPDVRGAAAEGLRRLGVASEAARAELVEMLRQDREVEVRKQAALSVGQLRERAACPALIELLASPDPGLRGNALWALRAIAGRDFPATPERWAEWWKREMRAKE
ncbi:MAG TPA: HEAT repeat domain-containing protein [Planctomycetota bacterium]|nr:HEAT repeat domain-containing protein [Planctomycetota bacterium]